MSASTSTPGASTFHKGKWTKVPVFTGLSTQALQFLSSKAVELSFGRGDIIIREGESGNKMFVIGQGSVRVVKNLGTGDETELATFNEGEFFGEMCILETLPRTATVQAVEPAALWSISSIAFYQLYQAMPQEYSILVLNLSRDLSRRLRRLDEAFAVRH